MRALASLLAMTAIGCASTTPGTDACTAQCDGLDASAPTDAGSDVGANDAGADADASVTDDAGTTCDGSTADLTSDPDHCGTCGTHCCSRSCVSGSCFADGVGLTVCPTGPGGCTNVPVNLAIDSANCGACACACPAGAACIAGSCACPSGATNCCASGGSACTDTATDAMHCGTCGHACASGVCVSGACR